MLLAKLYMRNKINKESPPYTCFLPLHLFNTIHYIFMNKSNTVPSLLSQVTKNITELFFADQTKAILSIHWPEQGSSPCALCFPSLAPLQNYRFLSLSEQ